MPNRPITDIKFNVREGIAKNISRGKVVINNGVANVFLTVPRIDKGGAAAATSITNVKIITSPSYPANSNISAYTVTADLDNPSQGQVTLDSVLGFGTTQDMRDFTPWLAVDKIVPTITIDSVVYFLQTLTYVGDSTARSIAWLEDVSAENNTPRAAAVFR